MLRVEVFSSRRKKTRKNSTTLDGNIKGFVGAPSAARTRGPALLGITA